VGGELQWHLCNNQKYKSKIKGGTAMKRLYRLSNLTIIMMLSLFIFSCSQLGILSKKEAPDPSTIPECKKNYTKGGIWPFSRVYKTWVKYSPLDYKKGFDNAVMAVKTSGSKTIFTDRDSGIINAEIISRKEDQKTYPVEIKLVKEQSSVTVHLSSGSASGDSGKECFCSFYNEFEKSMKRSHPPLAAKQVLPPKKSVEPDKGASPPSPPPVVETPKTSSPPPKTTSKTQVVWTTANLREGPGMKYKVVGKVTKGTSLTILEEKGEWYHVRMEDGKEAWISQKATSEIAKVRSTSGSSPSPPSSPTPSATGQSPKPKTPM
jgi:hypothetical protein